jgi:hypothetical protein
MRTVPALVLVAVLLAACGDDEAASQADDPTSVGASEPVAPTDSSTAPSATAEPELEPVDCVTDAVATFPNAGEIALQDGKAVALGGPAYTIFAGDYDVPSDGIAIAGAEAGPGQHLAFVATTVFNGDGDAEPLEIGAPIEWTDEFEVLTFAVILDEEGETHGNNIGAAGSLTVTGLDESSICVDVDYRDEEKSVVGTIAATIV